MSETPTPAKKTASSAGTPTPAAKKPAARKGGPTQDKVIGPCPGCGTDLKATMSFRVQVGAINIDGDKPEASTDVTMTGVKVPAHSCDATPASS